MSLTPPVTEFVRKAALFVASVSLSFAVLSVFVLLSPDIETSILPESNNLLEKVIGLWIFIIVSGIVYLLFRITSLLIYQVYRCCQKDTGKGSMQREEHEHVQSLV